MEKAEAPNFPKTLKTPQDGPKLSWLRGLGTPRPQCFAPVIPGFGVVWIFLGFISLREGFGASPEGKVPRMFDVAGLEAAVPGV